MNKVDWMLNGGFPELLDDLDFEQAAVRESFYGLLSAFGVGVPQSFILSGCDLVSGSYQAGFICLDGEVLRFDGAVAGTISSGFVLVWGILETDDPNGTKLMENATTRESYIVRRARTEVVSIGASGGRFAVTPRVTLGSKIAELVELTNKYALKVQPAWRSVGTTGQPAFENSWVNDGFFDGPAQFRKSDTGLVTLRGAVKGGTRSRIFQLPEGYRPSSSMQVAVSGATTGNYCTTLFILNNGDVQALGYDGVNAPANVSLCNINFYAD